jgi:hypothetical protein
MYEQQFDRRMIKRNKDTPEGYPEYLASLKCAACGSKEKCNCSIDQFKTGILMVETKKAIRPKVKIIKSKPKVKSKSKSKVRYVGGRKILFGVNSDSEYDPKLPMVVKAVKLSNDSRAKIHLVGFQGSYDGFQGSYNKPVVTLDNHVVKDKVYLDKVELKDLCTKCISSIDPIVNKDGTEIEASVSLKKVILKAITKEEVK